MAPQGFLNYAKVKYSDVLLMRMGFFNHIKLNVNSMIKMFAEDTWMTVDMLIDWEFQTVSIYVDGEGVTAVPFFTKQALKLNEVNAIALYGLTPEGISRYRNLMVCEDICSTGKLFDMHANKTIHFSNGRRLDSTKWIRFQLKQRPVNDNTVEYTVSRIFCMKN